MLSEDRLLCYLKGGFCQILLSQLRHGFKLEKIHPMTPTPRFRMYCLSYESADRTEIRVSCFRNPHAASCCRGFEQQGLESEFSGRRVSTKIPLLYLGVKLTPHDDARGGLVSGCDLVQHLHCTPLEHQTFLKIEPLGLFPTGKAPETGPSRPRHEDITECSRRRARAYHKARGYAYRDRRISAIS